VCVCVLVSVCVCCGVLDCCSNKGVQVRVCACICVCCGVPGVLERAATKEYRSVCVRASVCVLWRVWRA